MNPLAFGTMKMLKKYKPYDSVAENASKNLALYKPFKFQSGSFILKLKYQILSKKYNSTIIYQKGYPFCYMITMLLQKCLQGVIRVNIRYKREINWYRL
jgi:hypothetical protein